MIDYDALREEVKADLSSLGVTVYSGIRTRIEDTLFIYVGDITAVVASKLESCELTDFTVTIEAVLRYVNQADWKRPDNLMSQIDSVIMKRQDVASLEASFQLPETLEDGKNSLRRINRYLIRQQTQKL